MIANQIISLIASLGIVQGLLLAAFFLHKKGNGTPANLFLGLGLLGLSIRIAKSVIDYHYPLAGWQSSLGIAGILIAGPCLWFYGRATIQRKQKFPITEYLHFLPFFIFLVIIPLVPEAFHRYWNYLIAVVTLGIYLALSWLLIARSPLQVALEKSWFKKIWIGALIVWLFYFINLIRLDLYYLTGPLFYTLLIYGLTYLLINSRNIRFNKYDYSDLSTKDSSDLFLKIKDLLSVDQIYLERELSLQAVADRLASTPRMVSQAINENEGQNFKTLVNKFRIEKAIELMAEKSHNEKLATIAYQSGFGNITSFNIEFKKVTGLTPSEYKKGRT